MYGALRTAPNFKLLAAHGRSHLPLALHLQLSAMGKATPQDLAPRIPDRFAGSTVLYSVPLGLANPVNTRFPARTNSPKEITSGISCPFLCRPGGDTPSQETCR